MPEILEDNSVTCDCGSFEEYVWFILSVDTYICEYSMLHDFDSMNAHS